MSDPDSYREAHQPKMNIQHLEVLRLEVLKSFFIAQNINYLQYYIHKQKFTSHILNSEFKFLCTLAQLKNYYYKYAQHNTS